MNKKQQSGITVRRPAGRRQRRLEELERRSEIVEMKGITHCFGRFVSAEDANCGGTRHRRACGKSAALMPLPMLTS
jgi:hypothetical protein